MAEQPGAPVFFLGAGASKKAGVPTTFDFVSEFEKHLGASKTLRRTLPIFDTLLKTLEDHKPAIDGARSKVDVEAVLEALTVLSSESGAASVFLDRAELEKSFPRPSTRALLRELRDFIARRCVVSPEKTSYLDPLRGFLSSEALIDVFTVNYDVVFEQFLERWGYRYFDGFDLFWSRRQPEPGTRVNLHKIHGSVTWFRTASDRFLRIPVIPKERGLLLLSGERAEPLMLYPAQKELYSGPFVEILLRLKFCLSDASWIVAVGYSFRDESLTRMFREAAAENQRLRLILIGPSAFDTYKNRLWEVGVTIPPTGRTPAALEISPSPLRGKVVCLPYPFEAVLPDLSAVVVPALQEARGLVEKAQQSEVMSQPVDWRTAADKLVDALWIDEAERLEQEKFTVQTQDRNWRLSYLARKSLALYSFGFADRAAEHWNAFEDLATHDLVDNLSISPDEITYQTVSPRFGYEQILVDGKVQGARYNGGEVEYNLFAVLQRFAARVARYSLGTGREDDLVRRGTFLNRVVGLLEAFRTNQCNIRDYIRARPEPHGRQTSVARRLAEIESLPGKKVQQEDWISLARTVRDYEVRQFLELPWAQPSRSSRRRRKLRLGEMALDLS